MDNSRYRNKVHVFASCQIIEVEKYGFQFFGSFSGITPFRSCLKRVAGNHLRVMILKAMVHLNRTRLKLIGHVNPLSRVQSNPESSFQRKYLSTLFCQIYRFWHVLRKN